MCIQFRHRAIVDVSHYGLHRSNCPSVLLHWCCAECQPTFLRCGLRHPKKFQKSLTLKQTMAAFHSGSSVLVTAEVMMYTRILSWYSALSCLLECLGRWSLFKVSNLCQFHLARIVNQ